MGYSTYNGRLELLANRPQEVRDGWRPAVKSPTEIGEQLVCTALYWLSQDVTEESKNSGKYIDLFKQDYYGKDAASQKQSAYCAVFAWWLMNEATKNMGCTHKFPGNAETWGNARDTMTKASKIYANDLDNPTVGSLMYRYSTESNASGHYGLVIDVDSKNRTFDTVEGNVAINADRSKEGVACWRYRFDDIKQSNGIVFIHIEQEKTCSGAKAQSYKGFECRPVTKETQTPEIAEVLPPCIKKVGTRYFYNNESNQAIGEAIKGVDGNWYMMGLKAGQGWVKINDCNYGYTPDVVEDKKTPPPAPEKDYSPEKDTATPPAKKVEKCKYTIVSVPPKSQLQHFEVLRDPKVLADICVANIGSEASRFGSALWYNRPDVNPGTNTGFGMFKDQIGNLIYVLDEDQPESQQILQNGFLGFKATPEGRLPDGINYIWVHRNVRVYNGNGYAERFVNDLANNQFLFNEIDKLDPLSTQGPFAYIPPGSQLNNILDWRHVQGRNLINYLKEIENQSKPLNQPIVIVISKRGTPPSAVAQLKKVLSVVGSVSSVVGIPIPSYIMKTADSLVAVAEGRTSLSQVATNLVQLAEFFAPEYVKDANNLIATTRKQVGSYLKQAENVFGDYINNKNISPSILRGLESKLGLDNVEIEKLLNRYIGGLGQSSSNPDLSKILKGFELNNIGKIIENTTNVLMLDTVRRELKEGRLAFNIANESNPIRNIPVLQDLFIAGGSNAAFGAFPGIEDFTNKMLNHDTVKNLINGSANAPEMIASLIGNNFGSIPVDKSIMKTFQIEALIGKALQTDRNTPFALPQSIEDEYKECFKFIIEQESDRKVLWCPDGWEWDHDLRKCVNKTKSSGYTPTNTNTSIGTGVIDNKKIITEEPRKSGGSTGTSQDIGFIPNDWTYYGDIPIKNVLPPTELPTPPVKKEILPPCITAEGSEYYYYPNKTKQSTQIIYETSPATTMTSLPGGANSQIVRTVLKPNEYVSLPGGIVSVPANGSFVQGANVSSGFSPVNSGSYGNTGLAMPLPYGLSDEVLPDKIRVYRTNTGTSSEAWFVRIDGVVYDFDPIGCKIIGWDPTKKVDIEIPDKICPPTEAKEAEKLVKKMQEQLRELETQLALERAKSKQTSPQPDERIIALEKQIETAKLQNQQKEAMLLEEIKKISNAKPETSPELIAQLDRSQNQIAELTRIVNEKNKVVDNPNEAVLKEIALLKQELNVEKNRSSAIQTATPQVQRAVEQCTDCDIAKLPSRVVSITEYGNHTKRSNCNGCDDCEDCDCDECN